MPTTTTTAPALAERRLGNRRRNVRLQFWMHVAVALAVVAGGLFLSSRLELERFLSTHSETLSSLGTLDHLDARLDARIWSAVYLGDADGAELRAMMRDLRAELGGVQSRLRAQGDRFDMALHHLGGFAGTLAAKEKNLGRFLELNGAVRAGSTAVSDALLHYLDRLPGAADHEPWRAASAPPGLGLALASLDPRALALVRHRLAQQGADIPPRDAARAAQHQELVNRLDALLDRLPAYHRILQGLGTPRASHLEQARAAYVRASESRARTIVATSLALTAGFVLLAAFIVYLLAHVDRSHRQLVRLHQELQDAAGIDTLTRLPNRIAFGNDADAAHAPALLLVNIDGFKHINDFYGHQAGDEVLRRLSETLQAQTRDSRLYRLGGDDFGVLVEGDDPAALAERLVRRVDETRFRYAQNDISVSVSIGISEQQPLLETADLALKEVKRSRVRWLRYSAHQRMERRVAENLRKVSQLRSAISNDRIVPYFMPIMSNRTNRIERYECLVRLVGANGTLVPPNAFLDAAKESRLYADLTRIMVAKSLETFVGTDYQFSINLSIEDILDEEVTRFLFAQLRRHPDLGSRLMLEILEGEEIGNYEAVRSFVDEARTYGTRIAIDDFGAGYSNLQHLLRLQVNSLKIDASLVADIDKDPNARAAVAAIVELARNTGIESTTAEYVHSEAVLQVVKSLGVDYSQGYLIGPPGLMLVDGPRFLAA